MESVEQIVLQHLYLVFVFRLNHYTTNLLVCFIKSTIRITKCRYIFDTSLIFYIWPDMQIIPSSCNSTINWFFISESKILSNKKLPSSYHSPKKNNLHLTKRRTILVINHTSSNSSLQPSMNTQRGLSTWPQRKKARRIWCKTSKPSGWSAPGKWAKA